MDTLFWSADLSQGHVVYQQPLLLFASSLSVLFEHFLFFPLWSLVAAQPWQLPGHWWAKISTNAHPTTFDLSVENVCGWACAQDGGRDVLCGVGKFFSARYKSHGYLLRSMLMNNLLQVVGWVACPLLKARFFLLLQVASRGMCLDKESLWCKRV